MAARIAVSVGDSTHSVQASDISEVTIEHFSTGKTTLVVVGGAVAALAIAIAATGSGGSNLGGLTKGP